MDNRDQVIVNERGERMTQRQADQALARCLHSYADRLNQAVTQGASDEQRVAQVRATADFIQRWAAE